MTPSDLVQLATQIVDDAAARGATVRLFGGLAVYAHCESIATHPKLQRTNADMDLVAPRDAWPVVEAVLGAHGFHKTAEAADLHYEKEGVTIELAAPLFREGHTFDLSPRLSLEPLTASLADLLLFKLQRRPFAEKDRQDAIALLLDHRVGDADAEETIGLDRLAGVACRNFPLWNTVYENTIALEQVLDHYLEREEAQLVWRRIEQIQGELDRRGKSLVWWSRALLDRHRPWYH